MDMHQLIVVTDQSAEECRYIDRSIFGVFPSPDLASLQSLPLLREGTAAMLVIDHRYTHARDPDFYDALHDIGREFDIPLVVIHPDSSLEQKMRALDAGFKDVISPDQPVEEITTRLLREIYHNIANRQLKLQLNNASDAALAAMRESSNLGSNVHFLVQAHQCDNLDELGQMFFQTMNKYGLHCSLQMRSLFGEKNMEANGMPRPLESELLSQLKDGGRYYDFGQRTVVNYGSVSVLIRNMPADEALYGLVKDNTFTLLQGLDARVGALDQQEQLRREKQAMERLSERVNAAMAGVSDEYQQVMQSIVDVVENMAERISERIPLLLLNEDQEQFIEQTVQDCVDGANTVFADGFQVDRHFCDLREEIETALVQTQQREQHRESTVGETAPSADDFQDVELF